jgi:hypothetical protein
MRNVSVDWLGGKYICDDSWVKMISINGIECNGGDGTAKSSVDTLLKNVKGYNWDMQLSIEGVNACQFRMYT